MLISYKHKFLFIHNYKVAGTSIKHSLKKYGLICPIFQNHKFNKFIERYNCLSKLNNDLLKVKLTRFKPHLRAKELKRILGVEIWKQFYKFGFVRNPWSWQVSLYNFMLQMKNHFQHDLAINFENFTDYLEWRVNEDKHLQKEFFFVKTNNCLVDFIGKMENIEKDFKYICDKIGVEAKLPHKNPSKHKPYQEYYNSYTKDLVAKNFKEDIELFNYTFNS